MIAIERSRGGRTRERCDDAGMLALEMGSGAMSQEMQVVSRNEKRQENGFSHRASRREHRAPNTLTLAQGSLFRMPDLQNDKD